MMSSKESIIEKGKFYPAKSFLDHNFPVGKERKVRRYTLIRNELINKEVKKERGKSLSVWIYPSEFDKHELRDPDTLAEQLRDVWSRKPAVSTRQQTILNELASLAKGIYDNFDDIRQKQILFFKLKRESDNLWESSLGDIKRIALRLESFINNTKSEDLKKSQINSLKMIFNILKNKGEGGKEEIKQMMADNNMWTLPKIKGLIDLYTFE